MQDGGFWADRGLITRRRALVGALAAGGAGALWWRGMAGATVTGTAADGTVCVSLPGETAGPFPGDGTNQAQGRIANVLAEEGVLRQDIRPSFAGYSGTAEGVPLELELTFVATGAGCGPLAGRAVYLWHCDAVDRYSMYSLPEANYLRGLGITDAAGVVRFTTIFPGCYDGRWPHLHFEVFASPEAATTGDAAILTSQFAFSEADSRMVYADARYAGSAANLDGVSLARDGIFRDNSPEEVAAATIALSGGLDGMRGTATVGL